MNKNLDEVEFNTPLEDFLEQELKCCLCHNDLVFEHEFDHLNQKVKETTKCSQCHVQLRLQEFPIH